MELKTTMKIKTLKLDWELILISLGIIALVAYVVLVLWGFVLGFKCFFFDYVLVTFWEKVAVWAWSPTAALIIGIKST